MHAYGADFYRYAAMAVASAHKVIPILKDTLDIHSVVDFGCAHGAWLSAWRESGADIAGVDGPYVDRAHLMIDPATFTVADLAEPIDLGQRFDLVQSLEVAEHIAPRSAEQFIATLVRHGTCVLFSAAVPGQGGEHHVNEQPMEYWRSLFRAHDYVAVDYVRPRIRVDHSIQYWYRYNIMLFIHSPALAKLPEKLRADHVPDGTALRNEWPWPHRARHVALRLLPPEAIDVLSRLKSRLVARGLIRPG